MKRLIFAGLLCIAFVSQGLAQGSPADAPASKEDVERYLQAVHSHDMMVSMLSAMVKPMHEAVHEQYLKQKDKLPPDFEARMNKMTDDMMKNMPFDQMTEASIPAYQKHFTKGDMDALIAFYSSPTGQKLLRETPALMTESMQAMMPIIRERMAVMDQRLKQEAATMATTPATTTAK